MIDEYWTWRLYGYHSDELSPKSHKPIVAVCDGCCRYRILKKAGYKELCKSCVQIGRTHTEEWKIERSIAMMGEKNPMYGKRGSDTPFYGRHHTEEVKKSSRERCLGKHPTEEARHKMSIARSGENNPMYGRRGEKSPLFGRHHSDETKKKMAESATGRTFSEEHCNNLSLSKAGKKLPPFTDDHKQKISASHQGIPYEEWEGFSTDKKYCEKFDVDCKERNRDKYNRRCFLCGKPESENITSLGDHKKLSVHHVDMNKNQGCDGHEWKLVPLCINCHARSHSDLWQARIEYLLKEIY